MRYFEIYALQRSGSHAIENWLFNQFSKQVLFFTNAIPNRDPVYHMRNPETDLLQNIIPLRHYWDNPDQRENIKLMTPDTVAISFENIHPDLLGRAMPLQFWWFEIDSPKKIIILRDFYNWIASRIKHHEARGKSKDHLAAAELWKSYIRRPCKGDIFPIHYARWFYSRSYRYSILSDLDLRILNDDISFMSKSGGGSSFDGRSFQGRPQEMDIMRRWSYLLQDQYEDLREAFKKDDELNELNMTHFQQTCPF